ncbi:SDR family NAD(P)-dependent oxidoreductase [Microscilla marina]|uniref:3-oxoacyl-acyl carrier protein reductase n=1 Tax=Microscilla marina ATCC 23134 TaxID=313606 RepID=A1ZPR6_MICM2|nr:SDR family NAD(P)-dependent oxidoreductase [Microscilla marina]EAY27571.1 3-oxoacyl-acyl carrier protein reductase [Microscilla marina ATCC 23134]
MEISLQGKNILVTGASRGIGAAISQQLGKSGARVAVHYGRNAEKAQEVANAAGNGAQVFRADLNNDVACQQLFTDVVAAFGGVDVLVNNAGIAIQSSLDATHEQWVQDWNQTMQVNLTAAAILSRLAIKHFQQGSGGRLIHIASRAAFRGDTADYMGYAASKAGMVALSRSIARAYGKQGITSFVIAPGFTATEMAQDFIDEYGMEYAMQGVALDRLTKPTDLAPTIVLLASGLSDHATGCTIDINAGSYVH